MRYLWYKETPLYTRFKSVMPPTSSVRHQHHILAYNDVSDRCKTLDVSRSVILTARNGLKLGIHLRMWLDRWNKLIEYKHSISVTNIIFWHIMILMNNWNVINMQKNDTSILFLPPTSLSPSSYSDNDSLVGWLLKYVQKYGC